MAIINHWNTIEEANKLTQSKLLAGVVQECYKSGELIQRLPVFTIDSLSVIWNREDVLPAAEPYAEGTPLAWRSDVSYKPQVTFGLKHYYAQRVLDNIRAQQYKNPNDYRTQLLLEMSKGLALTMEDKLFYADAANPLDFDGLLNLPAYVTAETDSKVNMAVDGGETALSMMTLKRFIRRIKPKPDGLWMNPVLIDRLSWAAQFGVDSGTADTASTRQQVAAISRTTDEFGKSIWRFDGIPLIETDFLVAEQANTGPYAATTKRAKYSSGTAQYSIVAMRFGQIEDGGVCLMMPEGGGGAEGLFKETAFEKLENYDAAGIRLTAHVCPVNGSTRSLGVLYDITDAAVTL